MASPGSLTFTHLLPYGNIYAGIVDVTDLQRVFLNKVDHRVNNPSRSAVIWSTAHFGIARIHCRSLFCSLQSGTATAGIKVLGGIIERLGLQWLCDYGFLVECQTVD